MVILKIVIVFTFALSSLFVFAERSSENFSEILDARSLEYEIDTEDNLDVFVWNLFMLSQIDSSEFKKSKLHKLIQNSDLLLFQEIC